MRPPFRPRPPPPQDAGSGALDGVDRETIRVYFREGLLPSPVRPKRNVAHYSDVHVRGILTVRNLHQNGRVPLKQIRRAMSGDALAIPSDATSFVQLEALVAAQMDTGEALVPLSRIEAQCPGRRVMRAPFRRSALSKSSVADARTA